MRPAQLIPYMLPSISVSLSAVNQQLTVPLGDIPKQWNGRIAHLAELHYHAVVTPTYTAVPTTVGNNQVFKSCDVWDGSFARFVGGFNQLRAVERLHTGRNRLPDADTDTASASPRYLHRVWFAGPPNFAGSPADFAIPTGMLRNGEIRITTAALTDVSADTTVCTVTVTIVARLLLADEVRLPPAYQVLTQSVSGADLNLQGRALYEFIALQDSAALGNWAAGELGNITVEMGQGNVVNPTPAEVLTSMFHSDWCSGEVGTFGGPPAAASDDNGKIVNRGTPTALTGAPNDIQPVMWTGPDHRIAKLFLAESSTHLTHTGTQGTGVCIFGRILPQPQTVMAELAGRAFAGLNNRRPAGGGIKTLSKREYRGPYGEFMPWNTKVA